MVILAGLLGATGVALGAVAAHRVQDAALATASIYLVIHAVAVVALAAHRQRSAMPRAWSLAAGLLLAGTALFAGDMGLRAFAGQRMFPFAAPIGGSTMIAGWLAVAIAAILELRAAKK